jgi:transposase
MLVRDYLASTRGRVAVERLPAYAPELNPVEYIKAFISMLTHPSYIV